MALTRASLRVDIMNYADATGSSRWDQTAGGEVDRRAGYAHMQLWKRVLNAQPYFQTNAVTVTTTSAGQDPDFPNGGTFDTDALTLGAGDTQQNLYRIILVSFNNLPYQEQIAKNYLLASTNGITYQTWIRMGNDIIVPDAVGTTGTVWCNWTPTPVHQLASDSSTVYLPSDNLAPGTAYDDWNDILVMFSAAALLRKGGAETQAADEIEAKANMMLDEALQDLARPSLKPWTMDYDDSRYDWGCQ
jgi:hypothetical protein